LAGGPGWIPSPRTKLDPTLPTTADDRGSPSLSRNAVHGFDASAVCAHQIRHFEVFHLIASPIQLLVSRRKEVQPASSCDSHTPLDFLSLTMIN
jgi:hypothetical protein